jgi:LPS export ABC transporter protein LptC
MSCSNNENSNSTESEKITQEIISFTRNHSQAGYLKWSLQAKRAIFLEDHQISITEPFLKVYEIPESSENTENSNKENKAVNSSSKFMTITGDNGKVNERTQDIEVFGNVVGVSDDGTLYTERLFWLEEEGHIYAPGKVKIVRGDSVMLGENMTANPSLETVDMDNVDFHLYPKDEKVEH